MKCMILRPTEITPFGDVVNISQLEDTGGISDTIEMLPRSEFIRSIHMHLDRTRELGPHIGKSDGVVDMREQLAERKGDAPVIAAMLAVFSYIHTVYMSLNNLRELGPVTAANLANSNSIHTIYMSLNDLGEFGPATTANLATAPNLQILDITRNILRTFGPATADNVAMAPKLHTVDMSRNVLRENGPGTTKNLAKSGSIHTVNINTNGLERHGPETVKNLVASNHIRVVDIGWNDLGEFGPKTADEFSKSNFICSVDMRNNHFTVDQAIEIALIFAKHSIKLGIEYVFHSTIRKAIQQDNCFVHTHLEQAMSKTFGQTPTVLIGLIEDYADSFIEFMT